VIARTRAHPPTIDYLKPRTAERQTTLGIVRCLPARPRTHDLSGSDPTRGPTPKRGTLNNTDSFNGSILNAHPEAGWCLKALAHTRLRRKQVPRIALPQSR
jgi:hypothetical protein